MALRKMETFQVAVLLFVSAISLTAAQNTNKTTTTTKVEAFTPMCGTQPYNMYSHKCCNGRLLHLPLSLVPGESYYFTCCGATGLVDLREQVCCEGTPTPLPHGTMSGTAHCCRTEAYDPTRSTCCAGEVTDRPPSSWTTTRTTTTCCGTSALNNVTHGCCAGSVYDRTSEMCCGNVVTTNGGKRTHECCGEDSFERGSLHMCCNGHVVDGRLDAGWQCCGTDSWHPHIGQAHCCGGAEMYDVVDAMCCDGFLLDLPATRFSCCGQAVIPRSSDMMCCDGMVAFRGAGYECCGKHSYDPAARMCCADGRTIARPTGGENTMPLSLKEACKATPSFLMKPIRTKYAYHPRLSLP